jgi:cytochrome c-type biogenesis protein CcmF
MIAQFGYGVLAIVFLLALYATGSAAYGYFHREQRWVESGRRAMLLTFPLITVSALTLIYLLVNNHYEVDFVYSVTSREMPLYLKVTALWGGQAGSLLFWGWLMSAFATAVTLRKWDRDREFLPWVIVVGCVTLAFFVGLVVFYENPFARYWLTLSGDVTKAMWQPAGSALFTPPDGQGLNPLLRHPGMIIHPPMLYLGFVSFVIPFAFAIAALVTGRTDDRWIRITRRWTLVAWLFLSLGLVLGSRWAYDVLGWGGFWGWDPVEIAAFMPWLTGTAFLHSVMIQEKRGLFKHWNMLLVILTYSLVIFGTFLTRSGVLSSVHAFAQSAIGPAFFVFIGSTFVISAALLIYRWGSLQSESTMTSWLSREGLFLLNNLLFISILIVCFSGVIAPLISELITGQKITVGPPWYQRATGPLFAGLLLLMGVAPLSAWGIASYKNLGRALWKPAVAGLILTVLGVAYGYWQGLAPASSLLAASIGFFLIYLVACVTLFEFWRAARARRKSTGEGFFVALWRLLGRDRRRYGGYIIHLGVVCMALGIIGITMFQKQTQRSLAVGESLDIAGYTVRYESLAQFPYTDGRNVNRAVVSVFRDGKFIAELHPRFDVYPSGEPSTIPGLYSTMAGDLYVVLVNWEGVSTASAPFKVYYNPLVNWLWLGAFVFIGGTMVAAWPDAEPDYEPARARARRAHAQPSAAD